MRNMSYPFLKSLQADQPPTYFLQNSARARKSLSAYFTPDRTDFALHNKCALNNAERLESQVSPAYYRCSGAWILCDDSQNPFPCRIVSAPCNADAHRFIFHSKRLKRAVFHDPPWAGEQFAKRLIQQTLIRNKIFEPPLTGRLFFSGHLALQSRSHTEQSQNVMSIRRIWPLQDLYVF